MKKANLTPVVYAALYLNKKTPAQKVVYGNYLIANCTGNLDLTNPVPSLSEYQTTVTNLDSAISNAESGSVIDKQALETAEGAFDIDTRRLADYVQNTANANAPSVAKTIIYSAGMLTRKTPEPSPVPAAITKLSAIFTNTPGTILAKWKGVKYARTYMVYYSLGTSSPEIWTVFGGTPLRSLMVEGLTSGSRYYLKVVAMGVNGNSDASNIATCIAS
jgi:hypothetical protein